MAKSAKNAKRRKYTGINRLFRSDSIQEMLNKRKEGSFAEFFSSWKWIFSYSKKYKVAIVFYTVIGVASTTLSLVSSVVSKYLIDIITGYKLDKLWMLIIAMAASAAISVIFSSIVSRYSTKISIWVNNDIQSEVFDKIIDADWMHINQYSNGDLLNRFNNDVTTIAGNAVSWIPDIIINLYSFLATFVVILHYDVTMSLIALMSAPVLMITSRYLMRKNSEYRRKVLELNSDMMGFETETFYNFDTIKSFGIGRLYGRKLKSWQRKYRNYNLEYNWFSIKMNAGMSLMGAAISFVAFVYCLFQLWTNSITYGTMTLFLSQRTNLSNSFSTLVSIAPGMLNSAVSAKRIRELVDLPKEVHHAKKSREMKQFEDEGFTVRMRQVQFGYVDDQPVLKESDFIANPNEIVALIGPSGEGKTTMLRLILGLTHPQDGQVQLIARNGYAVEMNADIRQFFSYVPQGNTIFAGTIAENMRMVRGNASDADIIEALQIACAWEFVEKMENGIYSKIGERGRGVSEGQAQRIAIARAVLRNSPILMLDEATSALDVETERQVLRNIIRQRPNKTCIVTTHRPSVLNMCQRVYRVMDQRVTELTPEQSERLVKDF